MVSLVRASIALQMQQSAILFYHDLSIVIKNGFLPEDKARGEHVPSTMSNVKNHNIFFSTSSKQIIRNQQSFLSISSLHDQLSIVLQIHGHHLFSLKIRLHFVKWITGAQLVDTSKRKELFPFLYDMGFARGAIGWLCRLNPLDQGLRNAQSQIGCCNGFGIVIPIISKARGGTDMLSWCSLQGGRVFNVDSDPY